MFKIFIAEDEIKTLSSIKKIIEDFCNDVIIVNSSQTVNDAIEYLLENTADLLLLDINFPDGTGFDILELIGYYNFKVIFITAFEEYAMKAIKVSAADYLIKPINPKELVQSINRVKNEFENHNFQKIQIETLLSNIKTKNNLEKLVLKTSERINVVKINEIVRCESEGSYTVFYLLNKNKIIVSKSLKDYDEILSDLGFMRVHKSHLINTNYINSFEKREGGFLVLSDLSNVPVSVRKRETVLKFLDNII